MSKIEKYIIVDDNYFNNFLCTIALEDALGDVDIKAFEKPENGLVFIHDQYNSIFGAHDTFT